MSQINYKQFFRIDYVLLRFAGCWISESTETKPIWYPYYSVVVVIIMLSFNFTVYSYLVMYTVDIRVAACVFYESAVASMTPIKVLLSLKFKQDLAVLIEEFNNSYFQAKDQKEIDLVNKRLLQFKAVRRFLSVVCWFWGLMLIITPFGAETEQGLVFQAWFPFDITSSVGHKIAYGYQALIVMLVAVGTIYTDTYMAANCTFVGLQCSLLSIRLRKIGNNEEDHKKSFVYCMQHYDNILRFYKITNKVFGNIYFCQLFSSTISLCMTLFLISVAKTGSYEFFLHFTGTCAIGFMLLVPCWFATEMTAKSELIPTAAFHSNWADGDTSFKKDLMFFIHRTQEPLTLYGTWVFEISKSTFVSVLRAAGSYYTTLHNLNLGKN